MNKAYKQYKTETLVEKLCNKENIPLLEKILATESIRLTRLRILDYLGKLDHGQTVSRKQLPELFTEVKTEVDSFLGTDDISKCRIGYKQLLDKNFLLELSLPIGFITALSNLCGLAYTAVAPAEQQLPTMLLANTVNILPAYTAYHLTRYTGPHYNIITRSISLDKEPRTELTLTIAHEYTHHIQQKRRLPILPSYWALTEGIARGTERHIARLYREREDNEAYLHHTTQKTVNELTRTYAKICNMLGVTPSKYLADEKLEAPREHAIGNTYFYLEEIKKGKDIYKNVINSFR